MYVIALIGIGLVLHGFIMLVIAAYRAKPSWGIAVTLIPFAQFFFPIYHWDSARKPFMTFTFGMAMWLGTAIVFGQGPLDKYWLDQIGAVQSAENGESRDRQAKPLSLEQRAKKLVKQSQPVAKQPKRTAYKSKIKSIDVKDSERYLGSMASVTMVDGNIRRGKLVSAQNRNITLQSTYGKNTKGAMSYTLPFDKVASIKVVKYD